jgi:hypothetical protein
VDSEESDDDSDYSEYSEESESEGKVKKMHVLSSLPPHIYFIFHLERSILSYSYCTVKFIIIVIIILSLSSTFYSIGIVISYYLMPDFEGSSQRALFCGTGEFGKGFLSGVFEEQYFFS